MFYNTGISTYFWIAHQPQAGRAARARSRSIDARELGTKMRKSLGDKRKELTGDAIDEITQLYGDALDDACDDTRVKVFDQRGLRLSSGSPSNVRCGGAGRSPRTLWMPLAHDKAWTSWVTAPTGTSDGAAWMHTVEQPRRSCSRRSAALSARSSTPRRPSRRRLTQTCAAAGLDVPDKVAKAILVAAAVSDPGPLPIADRRASPLPDADLRDNENIPLPAGWLSLDSIRRDSRSSTRQRRTCPTRSTPTCRRLDRPRKTKIGYEIPFTRTSTSTSRRAPWQRSTPNSLHRARIQELLEGAGSDQAMIPLVQRRASGDASIRASRDARLASA